MLPATAVRPPLDGERGDPVARRLRPAFVVAGVLLVGGAAGLRVAGLVAEHRDGDLRRDLLAATAGLQDPAGLTTLPPGACGGSTPPVRCLAATQGPDALVTAYRGALARATTRGATSECTSDPQGRPHRSCLVRVMDGDHAVMIWIEDRTVRTGVGRVRAAGSLIRVDAD